MCDGLNGSGLDSSGVVGFGLCGAFRNDSRAGGGLGGGVAVFHVLIGITADTEAPEKALDVEDSAGVSYKAQLSRCGEAGAAGAVAGLSGFRGGGELEPEIGVAVSGYLVLEFLIGLISNQLVAESSGGSLNGVHTSGGGLLEGGKFLFHGGHSLVSFCGFFCYQPGKLLDAGVKCGLINNGRSCILTHCSFSVM